MCAVFGIFLCRQGGRRDSRCFFETQFQTHFSFGNLEGTQLAKNLE